jgi:hypothetical protein
LEYYRYIIVYDCAGTLGHILTYDTYGRWKLQRTKETQDIRYVSLFYCSRALEWVNIQLILSEVLNHFDLSNKVSLEGIALSWRYDKNLSTRFYKPRKYLKSSLSCTCWTLLSHAYACQRNGYTRTWIP